jgi:DNA-binding NarL/FixJ family response regulator
MAIDIIIADNSYLIREGLRSAIKNNTDFKLLEEAETQEELNEKLLLCSPDVLVIDYASPFFSIESVLAIRNKFHFVNILAITSPQTKNVISKAIENGVMSHLLKDCGKEEIIEAIYSTAKGDKFFCGKILDTIMKVKEGVSSEVVSCDGVKLSSREIEIIQLVADGFTNKQIADKLFLSSHTITTHRKNIMSKLGVNNTAGLVMFAIRQNLIEPNKFLFAPN